MGGSEVDFQASEILNFKGLPELPAFTAGFFCTQPSRSPPE
jgi:hypothetical protein